MNYNKLLPILLLIILLPLDSCNNDHTLKPEHYQTLGMPSHKKIWTNDDYVACNITLSSLKMNDPLSLPRMSSRKSGDLFRRMVSTDNLDFIHDNDQTLRTRAYTIQYFTRFQTEMEQMYTIEYKGKMYYSEELLELDIFGLFIHDRMLELAMIINNSDDPEVEGLRDGMGAVKFNYMKLIPRLLDKLEKTDQFTESDRLRLVKAISTSIKVNLAWMNESEKTTLKSEFACSIEKTGSTGIKSILEESLNTL